MNLPAIWAIYLYEMKRFFRTLMESLLSPVISTSLYFVVFGAAIGSRIDQVEGVSYGAFIVPGLIMLSVMTQSISNASFGIYFPKFIGTIFELLSAPVNFLEIVLGYVGAAATKSLLIGVVILITAGFFVEIQIMHPWAMMAFLLLTCISFSLFGFIIGIWAKNFQQLQLIPLLVITPLVFLGGRVLFHLDAARESGSRSPCSTRSSTSSRGFAGRSSAWRMWAWAGRCWRSGSSPRCAWASSGGSSKRATGSNLEVGGAAFWPHGDAI